MWLSRILGAFEKRPDEDEWRFIPAYTLVEAAALASPPEQGTKDIAARALFYLRQGATLLANISDDLAVETLLYSTAERRLLEAIFHQGPVKLSTEIAMLGRRLLGEARRLRVATTTEEARVDDLSMEVIGVESEGFVGEKKTD